jgi:hypothetical protein
MSFSEVEAIVQEADRNDEIIGVRRSVTDDESSEDPWTLPPSRKKIGAPIAGPLPASVKVIRSNLVYVEKAGLPSALLNRLHRLAAFQNPEFYRAQAMRLSTFGKPRVIRCAEEFPRHIALPRGCLDEVTALFKSHSVAVELDDQRFAGKPIEAIFYGQLRAEQPAAVKAMLAHDDGILPNACAAMRRSATRFRNRNNLVVFSSVQQHSCHWRLNCAVINSKPFACLRRKLKSKSTPPPPFATVLKTVADLERQINAISPA